MTVPSMGGYWVPLYGVVLNEGDLLEASCIAGSGQTISFLIVDEGN